MRYLLQLAYNGKNYHGWQKQHNAHSVQEELELKLSLLLGANIATLGCGRTDTGVHARQFYAHFDYDHAFDAARLLHKLNQVLPKDIAVYTLEQVTDDFNARFDASYREYEYWITQKPDPFLLDYAWYQYGGLDLEQMNAAAALLPAHRDFECFSKVHTQVANFNCEVMHAGWHREGHKLVFTIRANRFLRNMVRAIVGTIVEVGKGRMSLEQMQQVLESRRRSEAGQSVPAQGLYLTGVHYPGR